MRIVFCIEEGFICEYLVRRVLSFGALGLGECFVRFIYFIGDEERKDFSRLRDFIMFESFV